MLLSSFSMRRRETVLWVSVLAVFLVGLVSYSASDSPNLYHLVFGDENPCHVVPSDDKNHTGPRAGPIGSPPEYAAVPPESAFCSSHYSPKYLEGFRDTSVQYCAAGAVSNLTCFHSRIAPGGGASDITPSSLCFGKSAAFGSANRKFRLDCPLRQLTDNETARNTPSYDDLQSYWYDTGPRFVLDHFVELDAKVGAETPTSANLTILVKREGPANPWHSLLEIFSMTLSLDILRMTIDPETGRPFFSHDTEANARIAILDDHDDGPYYDLWTIFTGKPITRLADLPEEETLGNVVIPLAGATNPIWHSDWVVHDCHRSDLLRVFARRVHHFYKVGDDSEPPIRVGNLNVTFIARKDTRRLLDIDENIEELKPQFPNVNFRSVDFAAIPFSEQVRTAWETDVLVGVHGAGLTHSMFMQRGSAVVEILPKELDYKGFRNLAALMGHVYFSAHGTTVPIQDGDENSQKKDGEGENSGSEEEKLRNRKRDAWHFSDVSMEKERFMNLMQVAIKSMFNKGLRDFDTI